MKRKNILLLGLIVLVMYLIVYMMYKFNVISHKTYTDDDFNIDKYISSIDKDGDGVDDQTDILTNTREYINKKPKYKSKYYDSGYPDDEYGVCTDVVVFSLRDAGYDLMELVNIHILENGQLYNIDIVDKNIDFRRVRNLDVYFRNNIISLTTDIYQIKEWQGGDIVVFSNHIGIVSDKRNKNGVSFVIHHANPYQIHYEEDILENRDDIIGHYRVS